MSGSNLYESYSQEELERLILGVILNAVKLSGMQKLRPEHFEDTRNQAILEIILHLEETKQSIDEAMIAKILKQRGVRQEGVHYLEQLKEYKMNGGSFEKLVDLLRDRYLKRITGAK